LREASAYASDRIFVELRLSSRGGIALDVLVQEHEARRR
jgi:hypothetical protein